MTIVVICDYGFIKGGDSKVAIISAIALKKLGHNVIYFTSVGPVDQELTDAGIEVICTNQSDILSNPSRLKASVQGIKNSKAQAQLNSLLKKLDRESTIIHIHSVVKSVSPAIYKTIISNKFKFVTTLHDYFLACPNGSFFDYSINEICQLKPLSFKCLKQSCDSRNYGHKLWRYFRTAIQKHYYNIPGKINNFISISNLSESVLKEYLPNKAKIYRIDNPIELTKEHAVRINENSYFVFFGRISREKGIEFLVEASKALNKKLILIGDGPLTDQLKKKYPDIEITGWQNKTEVIKLLRSARAVVYPSLWYEVQPLVVLESLAMGLPVVVPNTSASRELIIDQVTGLLFKGGDKADLIEKMTILEETALAQKIGEKAFEIYWDDPFTVEKHVNGLLSVYNEILN